MIDFNRDCGAYFDTPNEWRSQPIPRPPQPPQSPRRIEQPKLPTRSASLRGQAGTKKRDTRTAKNQVTDASGKPSHETRHGRAGDTSRGTRSDDFNPRRPGQASKYETSSRKRKARHEEDDDHHPSKRRASSQDVEDLSPCLMRILKTFLRRVADGINSKQLGRRRLQALIRDHRASLLHLRLLKHVSADHEAALIVEVMLLTD